MNDLLEGNRSNSVLLISFWKVGQVNENIDFSISYTGQKLLLHYNE
jgi:hypothetical protein